MNVSTGDSKTEVEADVPPRSAPAGMVGTPTGGPGLGVPAALEPLTLSLLGRFFGVPLLIIGVIVGGAIVVVLLFGGPANPPRRSVDALLLSLESNSGERSLGVLLPQEKELWQAAQELTLRLQKKQTELSAEEVAQVSERLARLIRSDLESREKVVTFGDARVDHLRIRSSRLQFSIHALGRTETEIAVELLVEIVRRGLEPYVADAIQELGNLHGLPSARSGIEPMTAALLASSRPETLLSACTALSVLAASTDQPVIDALSQVRLKYEGEVGWSASLALARLGSSAGRSTLLDLLDRSFWEKGERFASVDASGTAHRYAMPPVRIEQWLLVSIDAASRLADADLWTMIERLQSDPSAAVRGRASEVIKARG